MKIENVLFDLDGTLTDPGIGITNSVWYALKLRNIEVASREELFSFIGPPLLNSYMQYYGLEEDDARQAITDFRVYFEKSGIFENEIYEGIPAMLKTLTEAGKRVYLATSKPETTAIEILHKFDLAKYFEVICGATFDTNRVHKADVIAYLLAQIGNPQDVLMVGDTEFDVTGAAAHGIDTIGVAWGYGKVEAMEKAGAIAIAHNMQELLELI